VNALQRLSTGNWKGGNAETRFREKCGRKENTSFQRRKFEFSRGKGRRKEKVVGRGKGHARRDSSTVFRESSVEGICLKE